MTSADWEKLENMITVTAAVLVAVLGFTYLADKVLDQRQAEIDKLNLQLVKQVVEIEKLKGALVDKEDEIAEMRYDFGKELSKKLAKK